MYFLVCCNIKHLNRNTCSVTKDNRCEFAIYIISINRPKCEDATVIGDYSVLICDRENVDGNSQGSQTCLVVDNPASPSEPVCLPRRTTADIPPHLAEQEEEEVESKKTELERDESEHKWLEQTEPERNEAKLKELEQKVLEQTGQNRSKCQSLVNGHTAARCLWVMELVLLTPAVHCLLLTTDLTTTAQHGSGHQHSRALTIRIARP